MKRTSSNKSHVGTIRFIMLATIGGAVAGGAAWAFYMLVFAF